jgi:hypothetical protein
MRTARRLAWAVAGVLAAADGAAAQVPAVPAAPAIAAPALPGAAAATAGAGATGAAAAPAAAPKNIWSFFMKTPEQKAQCKAHFCQSRIGQFVNNLLVPAAGISGGLIGPVCPGPNTPNPADLAKPAASAQGAAAKIKAEEAQAKAKVAAVEYLASVDCRYYEEAELALINSLRREKNECVRIAAAKAFASGCCCTPKVVKALTAAVSGTNKDGAPAEVSELVKCYAYVALERCLRRCVEEEVETPPEPPPAAKQAMAELLLPIGVQADPGMYTLVAHYALAAPEPAAKVYADARQALARGLTLSPQTVARLAGPRNVKDAVMPNLAGVPSAPLADRLPAVKLGDITNRLAIRTREATEPREVVVVASTPQEPGKPVPVQTVTPPPAPRPGRGTMLGLFQEAMKR